MSDYLIFGDVHGCFEEFYELYLSLSKRGIITYKTTLISVGDLIDKGPDSKELLSFFLTMRNPFVFVRGNHESSFLSYVDRLKKLGLMLDNFSVDPSLILSIISLTPEEVSGIKQNAQLEKPPGLLEWVKTHKYEDITYLKSKYSDQYLIYLKVFLPRHYQLLESSLPFYNFEVGAEKVMVVHGGINSAYLANYPQLPPLDDMGSWSSKVKSRTQRLQFVRYEDEAGQVISLGQETSSSRFWADVYQGQYGHVFFGHSPFDRVKEFPHATGLDSSLVFGKHLTTVYLNTSLDKREYFTQAAFNKYSNSYWED